MSSRTAVSRRPALALLAALAILLGLGTPSAFASPPSHTQTIDSPNSLNAISCVPSTTTCVVSDSQGNALYSTDVSTSADATWTPWSGPAGTEPSEAVACPATSLCTIAAGHTKEPGAGGSLYYATSLGGAWTEAFEPVYAGVDAISCVSTSQCVAGQTDGFIRYTTKPASGEWFGLTIGLETITAVDCFTSSFCAVVDNTGNVHVADTAGKIDETAGWKSTDVDTFLPLHGIACSSTTFCVAVDGEGHVLDLTINGSGQAAVSKEDLDGTNDLTAVTCTISLVCVAVDNQGNVFMSPDGGREWGKEYALGKDFTGVSCSSRELCVATDTEGEVTAFAPKSFEGQWLEVEEIGEGQVTGLPAGDAVACSNAHTGKCSRYGAPEGTKVTLHETPASARWKFVKWSGVACENGTQTGETCELTMPKGTLEITAEFEEIKLFPITVFVDGEGEVTGSGSTPLTGQGRIECGPSGGPICATEVQSAVELTAEAKPGYLFAGWVGCRNEPGPENDRCAFDPTGATEVIAVFLPEVKNGSNGTNGVQGEKGASGPAGPTGSQGPAGQRGPAGKVELVTCTKVKGKQHCKAKLISGTVSLTTAGLAEQATLSRHGVVYGAGAARTAHGRLYLRLLPVRRLRPGKYTLTLIIGSGRHERITSEPFTLG
ncbi:MAG TPA: collagen-like protein [Solirubrobacteraceae bacterium]|nr:collagen-like protein [Solirubrobacteraceae bacterium]